MLEICRFNFFNQILLSWFDVSNVFDDSIWTIYIIQYIFILILVIMKNI